MFAQKSENLKYIGVFNFLSIIHAQAVDLFPVSWRSLERCFSSKNSGSEVRGATLVMATTVAESRDSLQAQPWLSLGSCSGSAHGGGDQEPLCHQTLPGHHRAPHCTHKGSCKVL